HLRNRPDVLPPPGHRNQAGHAGIYPPPGESTAPHRPVGRRQLNSRISNIVFAFFASLIGAMFIYAFYASPMRERVENKLYDIRTRLALGVSGDTRVVTVTVGEETISRYNETDPGKGRVSFDVLTM